MPSFFPAAVLACALSSCVALAVPPSRSEAGTVLMRPKGGGLTSGTRVATGAHWASARPEEDVEYDVGLGYVYERLDREARDIRSADGSYGSSSSISHGAYLSMARVLARSARDHHRTWLGVRGEYLHGEGGAGNSVGASARLSWEVFGGAAGTGEASDACGGGVAAAYGALALGAYVEAGTRRSLAGESSVVASAGVSLRLPFFGLIAYDLCGN